MNIRSIELIHIRLPFKVSFRHFLAERRYNDTLLARTMLSNGTIGYGEGIPRKYLTNETITDVFKNRGIIKKLVNKNLNLKELEQFTLYYSKYKKYNSLLSAVELSILDAYYKSKNRPLSDLIGKIKYKKISYTGIISAGAISSILTLAYIFKRSNIKNIKIKVGTKNDEKRVSLLRKIVGNKADIRIDANCAWKPKQAVKNIIKLSKYNISAVEQPVKANDINGLRFIKRNTDVPIIVDESLININDANKLLECGDIFNIRISKGGGIFNSLKIYHFAKKHKKQVMLGCQVGETGILSAAGRILASCLDFKYVEGSYNRYLLKEDLTREDLTVRKDFTASPIEENGLGIRVDEEILNKYVIKRLLI